MERYLQYSKLRKEVSKRIVKFSLSDSCCLAVRNLWAFNLGAECCSLTKLFDAKLGLNRKAKQMIGSSWVCGESKNLHIYPATVSSFPALVEELVDDPLTCSMPSLLHISLLFSSLPFPISSFLALSILSCFSSSSISFLFFFFRSSSRPTSSTVGWEVLECAIYKYELAWSSFANRTWLLLVALRTTGSLNSWEGGTRGCERSITVDYRTMNRTTGQIQRVS